MGRQEDKSTRRIGRLGAVAATIGVTMLMIVFVLLNNSSYWTSAAREKPIIRLYVFMQDCLRLPLLMIGAVCCMLGIVSLGYHCWRRIKRHGGQQKP